MERFRRQITERASGVVRCLGYEVSRIRDEFPDLSEDERHLIEVCKPYSVTTLERLYSLVTATKYIANHDVPGAIAECGVYKGGSMMAVALTLIKIGRADRDLYLYDTYTGMTEPTAEDVDYKEGSAQEEFAKGGFEWTAISVDEVRKNMATTGYDESLIHYVEGKVEDTLPAQAPEALSLLRLDTDWYESTKHELEQLFPRLSSDGVLIIDDYGHFRGSRRAVDEYLAANKIQILLNRIDYSGRIGIKM